MTRVALAVAVIVVLFAGGARPVSAAGGAADPTFGTGGFVATSFDSLEHGTGTDSQVTAFAFQRDGKIIAAGAVSPETTGSWPGGLGIARYLDDGQLDPTFGVGGKLVVQLGAGPSPALAVRVGDDGKIEIASATPGRFALIRLRPTGLLDSGFGQGGVVFSDAIGGASAAAFLPSGAVVAGAAYGGGLAVARYTVSGALDRSFGSGGRAFTAVSGSLFSVKVTLDAAGRVLVAAAVNGVGGNFVVARFTANGRVDTAFASGGLAAGAFGDDLGFGLPLSITADAQNRVVIAGNIFANSSPLDGVFVVVRLRDNGRLDNSFGTGGYSTADFGETTVAVAEAVAIDARGRIYVGGLSDLGAITLTRFLPDGTLDPSFGMILIGVASPDAVTGDTQGAFTLAFDGQNRLLAGGTGEQTPPEDTTFTIVRFARDT